MSTRIRGLGWFCCGAPVALILACGGGQEEIKAPQITVQTIASPPPPPPKASAEAPKPASATVKIPEGIDIPNKIACNFTANDWLGALPLRFAPRRDAFASIGRTPSIRAVLPAALATDGWYVELDIGSAIIKAYGEAAELSLFPQAATAVDGFVVPLATAALTWTKGATDSVNFRVDLPKNQVVPAVEVEGNRPCAYFGITRAKPFGGLSATGNEGRGTTAIKAGEHNLLKDPAGKTLALLKADEKSPLATILARSGTYKRIAWDLGDTMVFGWVSTNETVDREGPVGGLAFSGGKGRKTGVDTWTTVKCGEELPLVAEVAGERRVVGNVKKGKPLQLGPDQSGWRGIAFPDSDLLPTDHAKLWVPSEKASTCAP